MTETAMASRCTVEEINFMNADHKAVALQATLKTELRKHCKIPKNKHWRLSAQSSDRNGAGLEELEKDFRKDSKPSKRERGQKFKTGERRSDERLAGVLQETRKDLKGIPRRDQDKRALKELEKKTFSEKESRTEPDCAWHRSRKGPFHEQEDECEQSKPVSCERPAGGDDKVLQQSVQRSRIDHGRDPAQHDSLAIRLAQGTRASRASWHVPGAVSKASKSWKTKNSKDGVTEKQEKDAQPKGQEQVSWAGSDRLHDWRHWGNWWFTCGWTRWGDRRLEVSRRRSYQTAPPLQGADCILQAAGKAR